jgi:EAL domain-containing protein (putative c-di-GMP-specific phosphodiesterase class I)
MGAQHWHSNRSFKPEPPENVLFYKGLIRIIDPAGRHIPARDFITQVENKELGRLIECATLQLGSATLAEQPDVRLSVNMSAQSIGYPKWVRTLEEGLQRSPNLATNLILEMTENSVMAAPEVARYFMNDMQKLGLCFALDNFGAGQTSLVQLRDFYFDIIKMDGQLSKDLARSADNQALIQAVIGIAGSFEMFCVAQNIETASDANV